MIDCLSLFLVSSQSSNTPFYPQSAASEGVCPNSLLFRYFHLRLTFESIEELGSMSLVLPCNKWNHWSLFMLEHHRTLHFDFILRCHDTWKANQFVKCATHRWSYAKNIPHNFNKWVVIGIKLTIHVPLPTLNGTWDVDTLL